MRNWVDSAQDRDYWGAFVNMALDLRVLQAMELDDIKIRNNQKCQSPLSRGVEHGALSSNC